ncbi:MAG: Na+/H+ antiporter NhaC family protein, partial [Bacteroidota bacterium]
YFGDKMSPLSDTTNLAPAMAGGDLFSHIRYMAWTTIPTVSITLVVFIILGFTITTSGVADTDAILKNIGAAFNISGWLFIVPVIVILLIVKKAPPLLALLIGTLLGGVFALIFQPEIVSSIGGGSTLNFETGYKGILNAITIDTAIETEDPALNDLFSSGGMSGMLGTIWLIVCAMVFGGIMDGIGALQRITKSLLSMAKTTFGLFASTVGSCLALNVTASDQYLALVVPGKMFSNAYRERGLAPENLSRTLEDSGTVTSVLVPWNTCGAYHSGVLGVSVGDYFFYAIFNWLSPFMTLLFAAFQIKIKQLSTSFAR